MKYKISFRDDSALFIEDDNKLWPQIQYELESNKFLCLGNLCISIADILRVKIEDTNLKVVVVK